MAAEANKAFYLIVEFNWPKAIDKEMGEAAKKLHEGVSNGDWIAGTLAASGGLGGEQSSIWAFELANYAALDRLLANREDPISQAYMNFFSMMEDVQDRIREKVIFV